MVIPARWRATIAVCTLAVVLTATIWLSEEDSLASFFPWPWSKAFPLASAANAALLVLAGAAYLAFSPAWRSPSPSPSARPLLPLRARAIIFYTWLALNAIWFAAGIHERDFQKKPKWLQRLNLSPEHAAPPTALSYSYVPRYGDPALLALRLSYGVGMAASWPLLANLFVLLLPADRSLFLLSCLGVGHEDGVLAHALCGTAVWVWASVHALLTQAPMLAVGLWRAIMLPPLDGTETKGASNCMGLMAWLCMCALGLSSLAPIRRRFFNAFQRLHLALAPALLLFGCLHDSKVFWYGMLGAVLYGADLVQRWVLRRRSAVAVATIYPSSSSSACSAVTARADAGVGPGGAGASKFVVLRIMMTLGSPGCRAGQHVWIKVPRVSAWEWHPYSVAVHDDRSFALVIKAGGDWETRLCREVERAAVAQATAVQAVAGAAAAHAGDRHAGGAPGSASGSHHPTVLLDVLYEGLYGTPDLEVAAAAADRLLLFAGGAGITPIASVLAALLTEPPSAAAAVSTAADVPPYGCCSSDGVAAAGGGCGREGETELPGGGSRVHLVWAVTQLSDAEPLMPLLRAAAARGWRMDLHCTRHRVAAAAPISHVAVPVPSVGAAESLVAPAPVTVTAAPEIHHHKGGAAVPPLPYGRASPSSFEGGRKAVPASAARLPHAPWQLSGAACWAVAVAAAAVGALGRNLGGATAVSYSCSVSADGFGTAAGGVANGDGGVTGSGIEGGGAGGEGGSAGWVASVRAAFADQFRRTAHSLTYGTVHDISEISGGGGGLPFREVGALGRVLATAVLGAGDGDGSCPVGLDPARRRLLAAAELGARAGNAGLPNAVTGAAVTSGHQLGVKAGKSAAKVALRVCRVWGAPAPELCMKCDPFLSRSPLESAWPCCRAIPCFLAPRLGLLLGWLLGALAGAFLACWLWRRWAAATRAVVAVSVRRAGKLGALGGTVTGGGGGPWVSRHTQELNVGEQGLRVTAGARWAPTGSSSGDGCGCDVGDGFSHTAAAGHEALAAAEEGDAASGASPAPGIRSGAPGLGDMFAAPGGCGARHGGAHAYDSSAVAVGEVAGGVYVHVGRPDVESYVRTAVSREDGGGIDGVGVPWRVFGAAANGGLVYGVVVCGPESLQVAVQAAYGRYVAEGHAGSWFRGFSFTT